MSASQKASESKEPPDASVERPRSWALWTTMVLSALVAAVHTFLGVVPTLDDLRASNIPIESRDGLAAVWHLITVLLWSYPVMLFWLRRRPATVTRPALTYVAFMNGATAILFVVVGLWAFGLSGLVTLPQWTLLAAVAVTAWLARPSKVKAAKGARPQLSRVRRVLLWCAIVLFTVIAVFHTIAGTSDWAADLLDSDTADESKQLLNVVWFISCVLFWALPVILLSSLRMTVAGGRALFSYVAALVASFSLLFVVLNVADFTGVEAQVPTFAVTAIIFLLLRPPLHADSPTSTE